MTHMLSLIWTNQTIFGSLPAKLPVKINFERFFISSKETPLNFRGTIAENRGNYPLEKRRFNDFLDFMGRRSLPVRDYVVSIKDGP